LDTLSLCPPRTSSKTTRRPHSLSHLFCSHPPTPAIYTLSLHDALPICFLLKHPLLVIDLGFRLVLDPGAPYGFDIEATLPCRYRSEEHTSELQSRENLVCRLLLEKKNWRSLRPRPWARGSRACARRPRALLRPACAMSTRSARPRPRPRCARPSPSRCSTLADQTR